MLRVACGTLRDKSGEEVCQILREGWLSLGTCWAKGPQQVPQWVDNRCLPRRDPKLLERWDLCFFFFDVSQLEVALWWAVGGGN